MQRSTKSVRVPPPSPPSPGALANTHANLPLPEKQIGAKKKAKENADDLLQQKIAIEKEKKELLDSAAVKEKLMNKTLGTIGNIIHDSVPVFQSEDDNPTLRTWVPADREVPVGQEDRSTLLSHHELLLRIDGYNPEAGVCVTTPPMFHRVSRG